MIWNFLIILFTMIIFMSNKEIKNFINLKDESIYLKIIKEVDIESNKITFYSDTNYNLSFEKNNQFEFIYKIDRKIFSNKSSIWISFYIENSNDKINFSIFDNSRKKKIFKKKTNKFISKLIFLKEEEEIKFVFENLDNNKKVKLNILLGCQFCKLNNYADKKDFSKSQKILSDINLKKVNLIFLSKMINKNKIFYLQNIKDIHKKLIYWYILEIFIIIMNLLEIYIMINLIKNKKVF